MHCQAAIPLSAHAGVSAAPPLIAMRRQILVSNQQSIQVREGNSAY